MDSTTPAVVDIDVISFLFKNHSSLRLIKPYLWADHWRCSLPTLAEIECGMEAKNWAQPRGI